MADDYGNKIPVTILTSPVILDKADLSNERFILGYIVVSYEIDEDATITIYYKRNDEMEYEALESITLSKDKKRLYRKLPLKIGSVIDYYVKLDGSFEEFQITTFKMFIKIVTVGKHS
jgi:hypothetical protein